MKDEVGAVIVGVFWGVSVGLLLVTFFDMSIHIATILGGVVAGTISVIELRHEMKGKNL